jgi:hypothetical protein
MKILSGLIKGINLKITFLKGNKCIIKGQLIYRASLGNKLRQLLQIRRFMRREINSKLKVII